MDAQDTQYDQDDQDPLQNQDPPDWEDPWDAQDAWNSLDAKAFGDAVDPWYPRDPRDAQELKKEE